MVASAKVSIAIDRAELEQARRAATREGLSLSAFFSRAVRAELEEHRRREAARQLLATFDPEDLPTLARQQELLSLWKAKPVKPTTKRAKHR